MKNSMKCVAFALTCLALMTPSAMAQSNANRVAVMDVSSIFKQHPRFKQQMEGMKQQVQAFEATLRQRAQQIEGLQKQLQTVKPNSPDAKKIESQMLKIQADGQAEATLKKKDFLQAEAKIYFDTYNEIVNEVAQFAQQHGISLVVRFNSEPINEENRNSVLEGVNRAVIYQAQSNITEAIRERIVRRYGQAAAGGATQR